MINSVFKTSNNKASGYIFGNVNVAAIGYIDLLDEIFLPDEIISAVIFKSDGIPIPSGQTWTLDLNFNYFTITGVQTANQLIPYSQRSCDYGLYIAQSFFVPRNSDFSQKGTIPPYALFHNLTGINLTNVGILIYKLSR